MSRIVRVVGHCVLDQRISPLRRDISLLHIVHRALAWAAETLKRNGQAGEFDSHSGSSLTLRNKGRKKSHLDPECTVVTMAALDVKRADGEHFPAPREDEESLARTVDWSPEEEAKAKRK